MSYLAQDFLLEPVLDVRGNVRAGAQHVLDLIAEFQTLPGDSKRHEELEHRIQTLHEVKNRRHLQKVEQKGLQAQGVTAAEATGEGNLIARTGLQGPDGAPGPNAEGVRVSLDSEVTPRDSVALDNGDTGVVALGTAIVRLEGGRVAGNKGLGVHARDGSKVELDAVVVENNEQGDFRAENEAEISGARDPLR